MFKKLLVMYVSLLALTSSLFAAPNGKWSYRAKAGTTWIISGTVKNGVVTMKGGSCKTTSSNEKRVKARCEYRPGGACSASGTGNASSYANVTIKVQKNGKLRASLSGICNGGRF